MRAVSVTGSCFRLRMMAKRGPRHESQKALTLATSKPFSSAWMDPIYRKLNRHRWQAS